jgi:hypothetical protein
MTSPESTVQDMKEIASVATKPAEPLQGLVESFLEIDDGASSGSEEEFLDFQIRITEANANLQESERAEHRSDWKASFASLQVSGMIATCRYPLGFDFDDVLGTLSQSSISLLI